MGRRLVKILCFCILMGILFGKQINCQAATKVTVKTYSDLKKYLSSTKDYTISIESSFDITGKLSVEGKKTIIGNGKCLTRGKNFTTSYLFSVQPKATLTIQSNLYVSGNSTHIEKPTKPLIYVAAGGVCKLGEKVNLYNNWADGAGGAIYCCGTLYIQGANIYNCRCNSVGGAMQLKAGAICYMSAGRIHSNSSSSNGGAVEVFEKSSMVLSGGKIDNNTCPQNGSAVHLAGVLTVKGSGTIDKTNEVYVVTGGLIKTSSWSKPSTIVLRTYPEVGKLVVEGGSSYKSYITWGSSQLYAKERPLCSKGSGIYVGVYYPIKYYSDAATKKLYQTQNKLFGTAITLLKTGPAKTGYTFGGWYTLATGGTKVNGTIYSKDIASSYYAHYSPNSYTVTMQSLGEKVGSKTLKYNTVYGTLLTPVREGYCFTGWFLDSACTLRVDSKMVMKTAANHTLYAGWKKADYKITFHPMNGSVGIKEKLVVFQEPYLDLPTPVREGYTFTGWYNKETGGELCEEGSIVKIASNHTLYARWKACNYTVNWEPMLGTASFSTSIVSYGSKYSYLPTATREGYQLVGWYTAPVGGTKYTASTVVKIAKNHVMYARWSKKAVSKTVSKTVTKTTTTATRTISRIYMTGVTKYYKVNKSLSVKSAKMVVVYSDKTKKTIKSGWKIASYKKSAGKRNVVFQYKGKSCKVSCTWLSTKQLAKVKPTKSKYSCMIGDKGKITIGSSYKKDVKATYKSSNSKVVSVNSKGSFVCKKSGSATITVTIKLGTISKKSTIKVKVAKPTLKVSVQYAKQWNKVYFKATAKGSRKKPVYSSSNTAVATINKSTGVMTAHKSGTATIRMKVSGCTKSYKIQVKKNSKCVLFI